MQEIFDFDRSPLYLVYHLVEEEKIDLWDAKLKKLINSYLEEIKQMELKDLKIPAKVVAFVTFSYKKTIGRCIPRWYFIVKFNPLTLLAIS